MNAATDREPLVVHASPRAWWERLANRVVVGPLAFAFGLALAIATYLEPFPLWWADPFNWMGVLLCGSMLAIGGYGLLNCAWDLPWLLRRRPLLVIDERGVTDRSSPFGVGFVAREEITAVLACRYGRKAALGLCVRDRKATLASAPLLARWFHQLRGPTGRASFVVSCRLTSLSADRLAHEIRERYGVPAGIAMSNDD